jgi:hypothetical protein
MSSALPTIGALFVWASLLWGALQAVVTLLALLTWIFSPPLTQEEKERLIYRS